MREKLRPEQKKLWRRIYLKLFEGGTESKVASSVADEAVEDWNERGAFDGETSDEAPFQRPKYLHLQGNGLYAWEKLCHWKVDEHLWVAHARSDGTFTLVAMTDSGAFMLGIAAERGLDAMLRSIVDRREMPKIKPMDPLTA